MWEKGFRDGIEAVYEAKSPAECRKAIPDFVHEKEMGFKKMFKNHPEYTIRTDVRSVSMTHKEHGAQEHIFYCDGAWRA